MKTDLVIMKIFLPCMMMVSACSFAGNQSGETSAASLESIDAADLQRSEGMAGTPSATDQGFPAKYIKAFTCNFDENPVAAAKRYRGTSAGRAERADDLKLLRSLGFAREGRDFGLESVGGKIAAPPGLTILGLPVRSLEINGMIGDTNAMYVTTFDKNVTVGQIVREARLELDQDAYTKYDTRHYSRRVGSDPYIDLSVDDTVGGDVVLLCHVQSTPH